MNDPVPEQLRKEGWGNCPGCGYFYAQQKLPQCPMCRVSWRAGPVYNQPPWESPTL
jgi:hypothetical protein